jgi:hypothetical protein
MTANDPTLQAWPAAMTKITVLDRPGDIAVVAHPAVPASDNVVHGHVIGTRTHFESEFVVTDLAAKANTMKPVWKHHRPHILFLRISVQDHITIFGLYRRIHKCTKHQDHLRRLHV